MSSITKKIIKTTAILFVFSTFLFSQNAENAIEAQTGGENNSAVEKAVKTKKPKYSLKVLDNNIIGLKGVPLSSSQTSDENLHVMKGRSIIGVNFKPLINSTVPVAAFNSFFKNKEIFGFKLPESINKYAGTFTSDSKSYGGLTVPLYIPCNIKTWTRG